MTIGKGHDWGTTVERPADLVVVADDTSFVAALTTDPRQPLGLSGGDMFRTVGARPLDARSEVLALPIDTVSVSLDGALPVVGLAHVVVRRPWWRGGVFRGAVLAVMNAEFYGRFDVAPRGHPNDGRVETLLVDPAMSLRQRLALRRRLPRAAHLPHPMISTRSVRSHEWSFDERLRVFVDGVDIGACSQLTLSVEPDATVLYT